VASSGSALHGPRPAPIDPRIRARRIEVQRGVGRRRLQRLVDVGLVLAVAAGFAVALRSPLLDVDAVTVEGAEHTSADLVLERAAIATGAQLMDVDLHAAGERVAALPWVDEVRLHRGLDGTVEVAITERVAVAVVGEGATAVLVDEEGRALALASDAPEVASAVVRFGGPEAAVAPGDRLPEGTTEALALAARLAATPGLGMELVLGDEVTGRLESGVEVRFGDATQVDAKVRSLRTVLDQVDLTCAAVIDVRSPGSPVLTREERCS
jgi:cell division septal protein FtsQ